MRKRTLSREIALMTLYAGDISKEPAGDCFKKFWNQDIKDEKISEKFSDLLLFSTGGGEKEVDGTIADGDEVKVFSDTIVSGVWSNLSKVDEVISTHAVNWELHRMATIDRNILRIASFELMFMEDTPHKVVINEAIELAKKYGDKDSGKFVNGILDKISSVERGEGRRQ